MEGRRMILFIITEKLKHLGSQLDVLHRNYITWNCKLDAFVKKEYANIATMKIDTIIVEQSALEDSHDLIEFQRSFPEKKIICVVKDKKDLPDLQKISGMKLLNDDEDLLKALRQILEIPEEEKVIQTLKPMQIGFLSAKRKDAVFSAISLVKTLSEIEKNTCFCEIGNIKKILLPKIAEKYDLASSGNKGVYIWNDISFICNAAKEGCFYKIFSFCEEDQTEKLYEQCDLKIWCESSADELLLHCEDRHVRMKVEDPFVEDHRKAFCELLGKYLPILEMKEDQEETEQKNELVSEIAKEQKKDRSRKLKKKLKKAGFGLIVLFFMLIAMMGISVVLKNIHAGKKKQQLKHEIQNEKVTTQETTQITTTEIPTTTEATTSKKNSKSMKKKKEKVTSTKRKAVTEKKYTTTVKKKKSIKRKTKKITTTQKKKITKKRPKKQVTTRQSKNTTEKQKNHTKDDFKIDYKVE